MKRLQLALLCVLILAPACLADSMDDAEAKKRGVSVEVVQLERVKEINDSLQSQIRILTAQVAKLKKDVASAKADAEKSKAELSHLQSILSPAQKVTVDKQAEIEKAIKEKRLVLGMTLEQARKILGTSGKTVSQSDGYEVYSYPIYAMMSNYPGAVPSRVGETVVTFENGILTNISH